MRCCYCCRMRCCTDCFLTPAEMQLRTTANQLFDTVNTETCCGCRDDKLSKTETMLLFRVLADESRSTLIEHRGLISELIETLRGAALEEASAAGGTITRRELQDAILFATSRFQQRAIDAIAAEVARDYAMLDQAAAPPPQHSMERGAPLLPRRQ